MKTTQKDWQRYQEYLVRYRENSLDVSLDISRMNFEEGWLGAMENQCTRAYRELERLEGGERVNEDENRRVGHYWLRRPELALELDLRREIEDGSARSKIFAAQVHDGTVRPERAERFDHLLLIGIGGSALGPQLIADALTGPEAPLGVSFFDNTDPDGMARTLAERGPEGLARTLCVVTSKSGGTPETRNGMLKAAAAYEEAGLTFARHAAAITKPGSKLDRLAEEQGWLERFAMADWVGGRTSVTSVVGLVPACLLGVDVDGLLEGAAAMDERTRQPHTRRNAAMLLALMWHHAGKGKGEKDMVILPYKDRLVLFSKYLQQLVMESLGKEFQRGNKVRVEQGIAVYGNKGSTDQHAYVQQLRDGVNNFFATFIEVRGQESNDSLLVEPDLGATCGDYLQGFLRGTRAALSDKGRESITLSIPRVDAFHLGALIALFERAVTFYAALVDINAYHQPGVEAGKEAAERFLRLLHDVRGQLRSKGEAPQTAEEVASVLDSAPEESYHILTHLAETCSEVHCQREDQPARDRFFWKG